MSSKGNKHNQQPKKEAVTLVGIVKAVHSGDSIVVYNQQGQEKELFFSNIKAPKIARNDNQTDEEWAFASREFLRKLVIGQQVSFTIEHKTEQGREYGSASLGSVNIVKEIVANGWATVKVPEDGKKARNDLHQELITLYRKAEEDGIGIFQKPTPQSIRNFPKVTDQSRLFEEIKGDHTGVVEYIRDGTSLRVLLPSMHRIYLKISGAEAPRIPRDPKVEPVPAYALEAKAFVEKHLLHRDVNISVRSPGDSEVEFYGTLSFKGRDVAEELIRNGFAKFVGWNAPPQSKETLQSLEAQAKQSKLRIWKNYNENNNNNNNNNANISKSEINGKIREIRDAANFVVIDNSVSPARKVQVTLSSIQVPRFGPKGKEEPFGYEAKEFIRKNFIGKKVRAELDFVRAAVKGIVGKPDLPEKEFWSVYCGDQNLAVALVENGFATVVKGNSKDGRSPAYEQLIIAEKSAQAANKNKWNKNKAPPIHNYSDLSEQTKEAKNRAKQFLPFFQRSPNAKIAAVVDYVLSPNRVKVYVPKENCMIVLGFEAIRTPKNLPITDEALEYVRDKLQERDVQISVDTLDKNGSFIGTLYIQKKNFGLSLVELGYAAVSETVDYSPIANEYKDAELRAKAAKKKLWQNYDEEAAAKEEVERSSNIIEIEEKKPKIIPVTISEIIDASNFFIHISDEKDALEQLMSELNSFNFPLPPVNYSLKRGEIAVAKFSDKKWYRVKVDSTAHPNYRLLYIDYGNTENGVNIKDIRPIPAQFMQRPAFAKECFLAYLSLPEDEYADEAAEYFHHLLWGKQAFATIEYKQGENVFVAIGDGKTLANVALTTAGYAVLNKNVRNPDSVIVKTLREQQEYARAKRNGRWEYGDFENQE